MYSLVRLDSHCYLRSQGIKNYKVKADKRDFGWLTVNEYLSDELASNSDDEKRMYRPQRTA